ncbi:pilin [Dyella sp.]|uniref:pilin n=1 Tax=Dyella sp. TaxID=1869338 RepID=UPI002ED1B83F
MKNAQKGFTLIELMIVVAIIAILAAIAIPQYQTYVIRSQVARAMSEAGDAKVLVEDCINNGKTALGQTATTCDSSSITGSDILQDGAQTGASAPNQGYPQITLPAAAGDSGSIVATLGNNASTKVKGGKITWTRDQNGTWSCAADGTIGAKYAPASCPAAGT